MDEQQFGNRLAAWCAMPGSLDAGRYSDYPHPLDAKLDALAALYQESDPAQRQRLTALIHPHDGNERAPVAARNLLAYVGRCGRRMREPRDGDLLLLGVTAAALVGDRVDERDLVVALVFLRAGAARAGIGSPEAEALVAPLAERLANGPRARDTITGVFRSEEATVNRIVAYHAGTG